MHMSRRDKNANSTPALLIRERQLLQVDRGPGRNEPKTLNRQETNIQLGYDSGSQYPDCYMMRHAFKYTDV